MIRIGIDVRAWQSAATEAQKLEIAEALRACYLAGGYPETDLRSHLSKKTARAISRSIRRGGDRA